MAKCGGVEVRVALSSAGGAGLHREGHGQGAQRGGECIPEPRCWHGCRMRGVATSQLKGHADLSMFLDLRPCREKARTIFLSGLRISEEIG